MNIDFHFIFSHAKLIFKEQLAVSLTAQQKRVLVIATIAMSCIAFCYALSRFCLKGKVLNSSPKIGPIPNHLVIPKNVPVPPFQWTSNPNEHPDEPLAGYEWVIGNEKAKQFLNSEKDLSIVAALAKTAKAYDSYRISADSYLHIRHLIQNASVDQVKAIVKAVANNRIQVRAVFKSLFAEKIGPENPGMIQINKMRAALASLSEEQLMNILAIQINSDKKHDYQDEWNEIYYMSLNDFLETKETLKLPESFVDGCRQMTIYAQHVEAEYDKLVKKGHLRYG